MWLQVSCLLLLLLPGAWLLALLVDGFQRSKYVLSLLYLFLSWLMIVVAFTTFVSGWENQMAVRAFWADEVAPLPFWVRASYDFFDRFMRLISATDLVEGTIYSLPALLIPLVRLGHSRRKNADALAFLYAAINVAYALLATLAPNHRFGTGQIVVTYLRLGGYVLLLLVHLLVNPTAVAVRLWSSEKHRAMPEASNG